MNMLPGEAGLCAVQKKGGRELLPFNFERVSEWVGQLAE